MHANGFSMDCYTYFIKELSQHYRVVAINLWGHGESEKINNFTNWNIFVKQVEFIYKSLKLKEVIGIGHSLGGAILMKLCYKKPYFFNHIIAIAPALVGFSKILITRLFPKKHPIIQAVKRRRETFSSKQQLIKYYSYGFKNWAPEIFEPFIDHQFYQKNNIFLSKILKSYEIQIFKTISGFDLFKYLFLKRKVHIITIKDDLASPLVWLEKISKKTQGELIIKDKGSHLFLFEFPQDIMKDIKNILAK